MRVIGFNFEKIQVERKMPVKGKIEISSNINVKSITQEKLDIIKEQSALKFGFEFSVDYKKDFAFLLFQGFVLLLADKAESKEILTKWKNKKISDDVRIFVFNFILAKCNLKALEFEEEFGLPPHIPLPQLRQQQQSNTNYAG